MKIWLTQCSKVSHRAEDVLENRKKVNKQCSKGITNTSCSKSAAYSCIPLLARYTCTYTHTYVCAPSIYYMCLGYFIFSFSLFLSHNCDEIRGEMRKCIIRGQRTYKNASEQKGLCILFQEGISQNHHEHFLELSTQQNMCIYRNVHVYLLDSQRGKCRETFFKL